MSVVLFGLAALMIGFVGGVILTAVLGAWLSGILDDDEAEQTVPIRAPAPAAPAPQAARSTTRGEAGVRGRDEGAGSETRPDWRGYASGAPLAAGRERGRDRSSRDDYRETASGKDFW